MGKSIVFELLKGIGVLSVIIGLISSPIPFYFKLIIIGTGIIFVIKTEELS